MSVVRGWCPSAHRPMVSGDGMLVRVRPWLGRLSADQVLRLCDLAEAYGSGLIDLTARANLQLRGVAEADHVALLSGLIDAGLVAAEADHEAARNVVVTPFWSPGDVTARLHDMAVDVLSRFELPGKMGVAVDSGVAPVLQGMSGDFRFETDENGAILIRADGAELGHRVAEADAGAALEDMIRWFLDTGGRAAGRMARHVKAVALPEAWQKVRPAAFANRPGLGAVIGGRMVGVAFGSTDAGTLRALIRSTRATALRVTPWRMLLLEEAQSVDVPGILSDWDPVLEVSACPGAPSCAQATVATRELARRLADKVEGTLHVSGCAKGCARPAKAALTLVGRDGRFDLVRDGRASDTPVQTGLSPDDILQQAGQASGL